MHIQFRHGSKLQSANSENTLPSGTLTTPIIDQLVSQSIPSYYGQLWSQCLNVPSEFAWAKIILAPSHPLCTFSFFVQRSWSVFFAIFRRRRDHSPSFFLLFGAMSQQGMHSPHIIVRGTHCLVPSSTVLLLRLVFASDSATGCELVAENGRWSSWYFRPLYLYRPTVSARARRCHRVRVRGHTPGKKKKMNKRTTACRRLR